MSFPIIYEKNRVHRRFKNIDLAGLRSESLTNKLLKFFTEIEQKNNYLKTAKSQTSLGK